MNLIEKTLKEQIVYKGSFLRVLTQKVELPNGNIGYRDIVRHPGGVAIVAFTDEDNILVVEQFRKPFDEKFLEIPAGKIDPNEDHLISALRELEEETGYTSTNMEYLGKIAPSPGFCDEYVHLYKATDLKSRNKFVSDEDEFITIKEYPLKKIRELIFKGEITDAKTIASIFFIDNK